MHLAIHQYNVLDNFYYSTQYTLHCSIPHTLCRNLYYSSFDTRLDIILYSCQCIVLQMHLAKSIQ